MVPAILFRFILLQFLAASFGGFLFYAAVVIPAASRIVGVTTQGFVTQQVTWSLNALIAGTIALLAADCWWLHSKRSTSVNLVLLTATLTMILCWSGLVYQHGRMDTLLDPGELAVLDSRQFYQMHRLYLWLSTIQWLASLPVFWILGSESVRFTSNREVAN